MKKTIFCLTVIFAMVSIKQVSAQVKSSSDSTSISFTKTTHDFGTIKQDGDGTCSFTFKNTGHKPLVLLNVRTSCGCTTPYWPRKPIMPGKTGTINIEYDTHRIGNFQKTITVYSNAKLVVLKIKGTVIK